MAKSWGDIFGARKVYHQVVVEIWDDGFQAHDYSYDHQSQEVKKLWLTSHRSYLLPDICFVVNILSQFQLEPHHDHWIVVKHILRYLCGTIHHCLKYNSKEVKLIGFMDFDWGGSETNIRSTTSGCFSDRFVREASKSYCDQLCQSKLHQDV